MNTREDWKVYGNVFSKHSFELLYKLSTEGYFQELESTLFVGKEANVFTALTKDNKRIIVKIYRLENCNFSKMFEYLSSDPRYIDISKKPRLIIFTWVQREYRNLMIARNAIPVPKPIAFKDNIILMGYIGNTDPAFSLKTIKPKDPKKFFGKIIDNMRKLYKKGLIHADLSPFNILVHDEEPIFIDFSQATTTKAHNAPELLKRDLKNVCDHFRKYFKITEKDQERLYKKIIV
jgi:RIO kinase 1